MKTFLCLILVLCLCVPAHAGVCVRSKSVHVVSNFNGLAVTNFAVPVGVPVAPVVGVFYAYAGAGQYGAAQYQQAAPQAAPQQTAPQQPAQCACGHCGQPAGQPGADVPAGGAEIVDLSAENAGLAVLRAKCAGCHSGDDPKGKLAFFADDKATPVEGWREHSRAIFQAVKTDKMPKGDVKLTPEEFTALAEFLIPE